MAEAVLKIAVNTQELENALGGFDKLEKSTKSAVAEMRKMEYAFLDAGKSISNVEKVTRQITDANGKYFKETEQVKNALLDQARALDSVAKSSGRATVAANDSNSSYKGVGGAVRNASYQLSDFMVQVQGGTSAMRAAGQQLPQLLAGFGVYGVVAGLAATVMTSLIENLDLFASKSDKASKALTRFAKELSATAEAGDEIAKFAKDFNQTAADGFVEYVKAYNKASESQRQEMDLWLKKKLLVEEAKLNDLASEAQGRQINFTAAMGGYGGEPTQFDPTLERQVELETLYRKQADTVKRLTAATQGDMATAMAGAKVTQTATIGIQQKIDAIRAEAQYIGINNAAKEKAIALAQFEAEAKRSGIGIDRAKIAELNKEIDLKHQALATAEIEKYSMAQQTANDILRQQGQVINVNSRENQKFIEQEKLKGFIAQQTVGWNQQEIDKFRERAQLYLNEKQALDDIQYAKQRTFGGGATAAIVKYGEDAANVGTQVGSAFTNAFRGMEDAVVQFTMTGKASFSSFAMSVVADIQRILVKQALMGAGAGGGAMGGLIGLGVSLAGSYFGGTPAGDGSSIDSLTSSYGEAHDIPSYAVGTNYVPNDGLAMIHKGEAIVPAKYNTAGGMGGGVNNVVTVNVSTGGGQDNSTANNQDASKLGALISNVVKATIIKEQRNGGLLSGA